MAVYTQLSETDIRQLAACYALAEPITLKPIAEGVENSNYLLKSGDHRYILTLYEQRVDPKDLPFFLELLEHLAARKVPCPVPVHAADGSVIQQVAGRPAAMVSFLEGRSISRIQPAHCAEVGLHLARMHTASDGYGLTRPNSLSLQGWLEIWQKIEGRAVAEWPQAGAYVREAFSRVEAQWPKDLPAGIIHADLFPDNVFFEEETLTGLIDFYFACRDIFAYDLAICLNAWCFETNREFNITRSRRLMEAYDAARPLSAPERDAFPILCIGSALRFLMTRMHDWLNPKEGALVTPKDPMEYLEKLKFHLNARDYHAYGL